MKKAKSERVKKETLERVCLQDNLDKPSKKTVPARKTDQDAKSTARWETEGGKI